jgi:hypothetical protein
LFQFVSLRFMHRNVELRLLIVLLFLWFHRHMRLWS